MVATSHRADRVLLHNISWEQFERLLEDLGDRRSARIAYDNGTLEIMTPLPEHEYFKEVIGNAVKDMADELALNYESYGSTTWRDRLQRAGLEPDNCFYFQNEPAVRGRTNLDLRQDPPPDLALEIDITNKSLDRFPIYARLRVPELWCYDDGNLKIYHLQSGDYAEAERSLALPQLPIRELPQIIEVHRSEGRRALRQAIRQWARRHATR
ncbi:Uma2 family endonuclease [Thermoleptolyngbya sichuanensis A183]|uniref:Uma2 family endonuclease n=1 Tax=Thermoleptolyngbya sichuanensis A183 TaxID=2737172 RepID=A0A6M8BMR1_9CYAN|nr:MULTISPECIES: Uma2 family endonuclease [Thermoleptolyngbya]QKD83615.1 Uma2 family endonuclease [Thermoleptolyngbya sichuanensis A183]